MNSKWIAELSAPSEYNINNGTATVPYDEHNKAWVKVGGQRIDSKQEAKKYAKKLDELIEKQQKMQTISNAVPTTCHMLWQV